MLTEIYIEALLVDQELADKVWELWSVGLIPEELAMLAWWGIFGDPLDAICQAHRSGTNGLPT